MKRRVTVIFLAVAFFVLKSCQSARQNTPPQAQGAGAMPECQELSVSHVLHSPERMVLRHSVSRGFQAEERLLFLLLSAHQSLRCNEQIIGVCATLGPLSSRFASRQSIPRAGMPVDVARVVTGLASDEAAFVKGADIKIDGAMPGGLPWERLNEMRTGMTNPTRDQ